ncbi:hypothetical protein D187_003471 [Cystobacter fuscus DSM 2262]|uniref:Uncharacterized protein n=1 Tax=Cystobacter fuscus (strain ATCC 25194 / DSM 2262 / NBRC 100088 / M29) TaxID=1242864 RepID=S9QCP0_CYSF2|nr:hypothetical protein D187_003471 [Cystobacter fuscus DSM 2262]
MVNPTPDMTRNTMLLDTATGDSWVLCIVDGGSKGWCPLPKGSFPAMSEEKSQ